MSRYFRQAGSLLGSRVVNAAGKDIGKVEDIVFEPSSGNIMFVVMSLDGPSFAGRLFAVPWSAFHATPGRDSLMVDAGVEVFEKAPSFQRGSWPDMTDSAWQNRVYQSYRQPISTTAVKEPAERTVVVRREYRLEPRGMSVGAILALIVLVIGLFGFTYMVSTRGLQQTENEVIGSLHGVSYAMKETSEDTALAAKVKTAYALNTRVPGANIDIDSRDGVITLRGEVASADVRNLAGEVAADTPGVREVHNHLYVMTAEGH